VKQADKETSTGMNKVVLVHAIKAYRERGHSSSHF